MKNLYKKYEEGGIGGVKKDPPSTFDILGSLVGLIKEGGAEVVEALQDMLGQSDMDKAMEEFNEKADQMPTDRGRYNPGGRKIKDDISESLLDEIGHYGPDRRQLPDMREMRSRRARYVPGGSDYKPFAKMISYEEDRKLNDTSGGRGLVGRTNPNVGEGINPRRRLFRRR
jgi:hypothetical protein